MSSENQKYLIKVFVKRKSLKDPFPSSPESVDKVNSRRLQAGDFKLETEISLDGLEITLSMYFKSFEAWTEYHEELKTTSYSINKEYVDRQSDVEESFEVVGYVDYFS